MHRDLICHFMTVQWLIVSPFTPHMSEKIWALLGNTSSVMGASWPEVGPIDYTLLKASFLPTLITLPWAASDRGPSSRHIM